MMALVVAAAITTGAIWGALAACMCIAKLRDANTTLDQLGERELVTRECAEKGRNV